MNNQLKASSYAEFREDVEYTTTSLGNFQVPVGAKFKAVRNSAVR